MTSNRELQKNLRITAGMIKYGEMIRYGQDVELMEQAANVIDAMQAHIDLLMFEYCPDEMTKEQIEDYEKNVSSRCDSEEDRHGK